MPVTTASTDPAELVAPFRDLYPFEHHRFETPAGDLHYVDEGPREGPVLLCVHGNPTWSLLFRHVIVEQRATRRVVAPDHLGCGLSDQPDPAAFGYRLADHVENLESLVLDLDLRRITLLVHDWGGPIGAEVALRHLDRFEGLVVTNTSLFPSTDIPWRIEACRGSLGRMLCESFNAFARAATRLCVTRRMPRRVRRAYVLPYEPPRSATATWRFVDDIPLTPDAPSHSLLTRIAAGLPRFRDTPTTLIWGERDWCFTPSFREDLLRRMPWARSVALPEAGHYLFEDDPAGVRAALEEVLA